MSKKRKWYQYLWIFSAFYLVMGFVNILFAWVGLACFILPIAIAAATGSKSYCRKYCGRGQLLELLGGACRLSRKKDIPRFLKSKWFRYGFLAFFLIMFLSMLYSTYLVFAGAASLKQAVTLLWTVRLPWQWAHHITAVPAWAAQFAFGFYSVMLTSSVLGVLTMLLFKPRSWCVYCPMGTMTQLICKARHRCTRDAAPDCKPGETAGCPCVEETDSGLTGGESKIRENG